MRAPVKILAGASLLLVAFLAVGYLLPNSWSTRRTERVAAPREVIFPLVNSVEGWREWTPWSELETTSSGPEEGAGASLSWDDPDVGSGVFTILESERPKRVRYRVEVDGGAIRFEGLILLEARPKGTEVTWVEEGRFGWNPLFGYLALSMERIQGAELKKGLEQLKRIGEERAEVRSPAPSG